MADTPPIGEMERILKGFIAQVRSTAQLSDPEAFEGRFFEHAASCDTYEEAYEETEKEFEWLFNRRKYSSYNSFRVSRTNRSKRNQG